jgi:hypothetical protein
MEVAIRLLTDTFKSVGFGVGWPPGCRPFIFHRRIGCLLAIRGIHLNQLPFRIVKQVLVQLD